MKKLLAVAVLLALPALLIADGNYTPAMVVSTTTGQGFLYPASTSAPTAGGVLVSNGGGILNWSNQTSTTTVTGPAIQSLTKAQLQALTPSTTGQMEYCSNCVQTTVVVSSGSTAAGQWEGLISTTTASGYIPAIN